MTNRALDVVALPPRVAALVEPAAAASGGMMDAHELECLLKALVASNPSPGDIIVELGTYTGTTACLIADALDALRWPNKVVCVDAFDMVAADPGNPGGSLEGWIATNARHRDRTILMRGFTSDVAPLLRRKSAALLIVDAYHSYEACYADISKFLPVVRPGGLVFVDDYVDAYPGVMRATNELLIGQPGIETVQLEWFGAFRVRHDNVAAQLAWQVQHLRRRGSHEAGRVLTATRSLARSALRRGAERLGRG
jgi:predicted O-methyltransferase YrrM